MAENSDPSQKTEEPTARRLSDARQKGDVASSREVANWFMLASGTAAVAFLLPGVMRNIRDLLTQFVAAPHTFRIEPEAMSTLVVGTVFGVGKTLVLAIALFVVAAIASSLVQHGLLFAPERIKPTPNKISPIAGAKRMFSLRSVTELLKGIFKLLIVGGIVIAIIWPILPPLAIAPLSPINAGLDLLYGTVVKVLLGVVGALSVMALADVAYTRYEHLKKMRMTKEEVKDEHRQTEGDPHVKARLRAIRTERARQRMMQAVPNADVVITNPTHFAVALVYESESMAAPKVVAKGVDVLAQKIREVATENDVPLVENPPLARALYDGVEIDHEIKPEHYKVVAEIIAFVIGQRPAPPVVPSPVS